MKTEVPTELTTPERKALEGAINTNPSLAIHIVPGGRFESALEVVIAGRLMQERRHIIAWLNSGPDYTQRRSSIADALGRGTDR